MDLRLYGNTLYPLIPGLLAIRLIFRLAPRPHVPLQWLGLTLALLGLAGIMISRWTLGRSFSVTAQARKLVARGIYSKVRNPIYISGSVFLGGLILLFGRPQMWALLAAIVIVQIFRARREASVLEAKFGDEYRSYRQRTWF